MATLASDWPRHFRHLFQNYCMWSLQTLQIILLGVFKKCYYFSERLKIQDGLHGSDWSRHFWFLSSNLLHRKSLDMADVFWKVSEEVLLFGVFRNPKWPFCSLIDQDVSYLFSRKMASRLCRNVLLGIHFLFYTFRLKITETSFSWIVTLDHIKFINI